MEYLKKAIDIFLHLDKYLDWVIQNYGMWSYLILFVIVFCETGLVVTPFLPGDSLLFTAGALSATTSLNIFWASLVLCAAAIIGDAVNYAIGAYLGPKFVERAHGRFIKKEYLERTHKFYEKYGKMTIILARFVPIVRTFAPFLAGVGSMRYVEFAAYNVIGAVAWVALGVGAGRLFGNIPLVRENFSLVVIAIVIISVLPMVYEYWRHRKEQAALAARSESASQPDSAE
jgi:membrane-associated protein